MSKLQESINRKTGKGLYFLVIPKHIVMSRGWKKGEDFSILETTTGDLLIRPFRK